MNSTDIHIIHPAQLPVTIDAIVEEQDTYLLLGKDTMIRETNESYVALVKKMEQQKPLIPGQVLVRKTNPVRFIAINYDIENKPICCEEWIKTSLKNIYEECCKQKILSLAMPLPGIKYGKFDHNAVMNILKNIFLVEKTEFPEKIFILHEQ